MTAVEIARRLAALGEAKNACKAYGLAIHESGGSDPALEMEAALYILQNGGDYKASFTTLVSLHARGLFQEDCLAIMTHAFYEPNIKLLKTRYQNNCKLLSKYPYLFRKDFLDFEFLPIRFFPFDDNRFLPYDVSRDRFGDYIDFKKPVVSRNFFCDLENPILAKDVYSQYELEYLNDNVRRSEYVGRENHIYLHYSDWAVFCAHLQCLNMRPLLEEKKIVFLIGDEGAQYPIDFKERFGIDYSVHPVKPIGIREIQRLIWHTQLSSHNGGDFFNEVFDAHPNLLMYTSVMYDNIQDAVKSIREALDSCPSSQEATLCLPKWEPRLAKELYLIRDRTDKDILVAYYLNEALMRGGDAARYLDQAARIVPALFFQPHFHNMEYEILVDAKDRTVLRSRQYETIRVSPLLRGFKYIKMFTPLRRFTTSHGASVKFMKEQYIKSLEKEEKEKSVVLPDVISQRVLNRSFMIDWQDRLYADSVLVRFEDAKLNPKATFTALAAFLDLPYTESMTYCSFFGARDPESLAGNVRGFDPAAVYRTYDEYANGDERYFVEYFLRDAYEFYGYDFQNYDGKSVDEDRTRELIDHFTTLNELMCQGWRTAYDQSDITIESADIEVSPEIREQVIKKMVEQRLQAVTENRFNNASLLLRGLHFVNRHGQPLHMMPKLELDPALLEQPLYH